MCGDSLILVDFSLVTMAKKLKTHESENFARFAVFIIFFYFLIFYLGVAFSLGDREREIEREILKESK